MTSTMTTSKQFTPEGLSTSSWNTHSLSMDASLDSLNTDAADFASLENHQREQNERLMDALQQMRQVLEQENHALLTGDAKQVGALAEEKLRISALMEGVSAPPQTMAQEIRKLGREVRDLANSNHLLIEHMHQYYTGIMSLMIKMNGQTQTYGQSGYMKTPTKLQSPARREIIA